MKRLFTSESVTSGHPDKVADQIADAVLDAVLEQDRDGRVACEVLLPNAETIIVAGEIATTAEFLGSSLENIVRGVVRNIGYTSEAFGLDADSAQIVSYLKQQSPDIAMGVVKKGIIEQQGAGDQGMMFGFAVNETKEMMPLPLMLAHNLVRQLELVRTNGTLEYLRPDGKSQVTVEYDDHGKPLGVDTVVVSAQHSPEVGRVYIEHDIKEYVILPIVGDLISSETKYFINPTGRFVLGGPAADTGLTGRKLVVDTYGGGSYLYRAAHGGGAFSGKDPSKVDRSAAYMARYIAKSIVASELAHACEVQLSYAIGIAEPVSVLVKTFGTWTVKSDEELVSLVQECFSLRPKFIIDHFDLKRPMYQKTAAYGHFGREEFPWEKVVRL